jgi:hypothetical protein
VDITLALRAHFRDSQRIGGCAFSEERLDVI